MTDNGEASAQESIGIDSIATTPTSVVYANTTQEVIVVTKDKLHLCLQQSARRMAERDRWLIPLGVLVPLVLTVATSGFTKRFGIAGDEWETVFVMLIIFTVIWLIYALVQRGKSVTVDVIIEELAKNPVTIGKTSSPATLPSRSQTPTLARQVGVSEDAGPQPSLSLGELWPDVNQDQGQDVPELRQVPILEPGDKVSHDKFGIGTVVLVEGHGDRSEAKIDFGEPFGTKHLVLRFAPLAKL